MSEYRKNQARNRPLEGTSPQKNKAFNIGDIRQDVKVPFNPPVRYDTMYMDCYADRKGSEEVGALTKEGNSTQPTRKAPKGEYEG